jgi:hypothetical protein
MGTAAELTRMDGAAAAATAAAASATTAAAALTWLDGECAAAGLAGT